MTKIIALVSGGIDSAATLAIALEQGMDAIALHYETVPFGSARNLEKTVEIAKVLEKRFGKKATVVSVPLGPVLAEIVKNCDRRLACVMCKRTMEKGGEKLARLEGANALLKGDSLGQVASQTLSNINAEAGNVSITVVRPLLGMDKLEIEGIARKAGVLEIASKSVGGCSIPQKPATSARRAIVEAEGKKIGLDALLEKALMGRTVAF